MDIIQSFGQLPPQNERLIGGAGIAELKKTWTPSESSCTVKTLNGDIFEAREKNGKLTIKVNGRKTAKITTDGGFSISKKPIAFDEKNFAKWFVKVFEEIFKPENQIDLGFEKKFEEYLKKHGK